MELSNYYLNKSISLYKDLILSFESLPQRPKKRIAALYSLMSESYFNLNDNINGCQCLEEYKNLWPEGFAVSQKRVLYYKYCTK
jgi:hypothetical protein